MDSKRASAEVSFAGFAGTAYAGAPAPIASNTSKAEAVEFIAASIK